MQYTLVDEGVPLIRDDMVLEIQRRVQKEPLWFSGYTKEDESAKNCTAEGEYAGGTLGSLGTG